MVFMKNGDEYPSPSVFRTFLRRPPRFPLDITPALLACPIAIIQIGTV